MASGARSPARRTDGSIRVVVQLSPGRFERWAEATIAALADQPGVEIAGVIEPPPVETEPAGGWLSRWVFAAYVAADRRAFPVPGDPFATAPRPAATSPDALGEIDLVLALAPSVARPLPLAPRLGAVAIRFGDHTPRGRGVPAFWEMFHGEGTLATCVEIEAEEGRPAVVLQQAWTALDTISLNRSRGSAARKVPQLVRQALYRLGSDGEAALGGPAPAEPRDPLGLPRPRRLLAHCARAALGVLVRRTQDRMYHYRWQVAFRERERGERTIPDPATPDWRPLEAPIDRFWADPFVIERDGRHWLFVEEYRYRTGRAAIAMTELTDHRPPRAPEVVLAPEHHVSYPCVFEHDGAVYMVPETRESGNIELYRAHDFPRDWRLERVLIEDARASDPTIAVHDGRFWLFAAVQDPHERFADELCLWWADDLTGPWHRHPLNPVVSDVRSARPAGALFHRDGALVRPGQDCSRGYGHAITLNQIDVLSVDDYREREIGRVAPGRPPSVLAIHSLNADDAFEVIDVNRRMLRIRLSPIRRRAALAATTGYEPGRAPRTG
jgi:hypothetical protein